MLALALDPVQILARPGMKPDPWQWQFLLCPHQQTHLWYSRSAGKSRTASVLAVPAALSQAG